jgi:hypothetical protein
VAYLDDDNWWAPDHLASLRQAIEGHDWSWSLRWFVEPESREVICIDEWESVGPDAGLFKEKFGGFVDPSSLMIDKLACHHAIPLWSLTSFADGRGSDRLVFSRLREGHQARGSGQATSFYTINAADSLHTVRLQQIRRKGIRLPAERKLGITELAEVAAAWRLPAPAAPLAEEVSWSEPVAALLRHLRPAEIIVLGSGDGAGAVELARAVRAVGLNALILAMAEPSPRGGGRLRRRLTASGLTSLIATPPPQCREPATLLLARHVAADIVLLGPDAASPAAQDLGWKLLRPGGMLLGGRGGAAVRRRLAGATINAIIDLDIPELGVSWIVEKAAAVA